MEPKPAPIHPLTWLLSRLFIKRPDLQHETFVLSDKAKTRRRIKKVGKAKKSRKTNKRR